MNYDIDYYKDEVHCLYDEKKELQERIDKVIEYIEKYGKTIEEIAYKNGTCEDSLQEILDILKGSDSNGYNKE